MEDHTARGSGLAHIHYIVIWSVKLTLVAVYGTQGQVQLLGGLQVRNRGESKRVPVQVRPPAETKRHDSH